MKKLTPLFHFTDKQYLLHPITENNQAITLTTCPSKVNEHDSIFPDSSD
jgi:hypothetical protein